MTTLIDDLVPDELWALVAPLLPAPPRPPYGGRHRTIPDRNCFAAIVYMARTSTPWRLLPARELGCGSPATCWRRLTEWPRPACSTPSTWRSWTGWASRAGWTGRGRVWTP
jgi:transposase